MLGNAAECSVTDGHYFGKNTGVRRAKVWAQFKFYFEFSKKVKIGQKLVGTNNSLK